jgi:hypothetical protein
MILMVLLLAAHAPLFFNDGVFMDDWLVLKLGPHFCSARRSSSI